MCGSTCPYNAGTSRTGTDDGRSDSRSVSSDYEMTNFRFLDLPAELRYEILCLVLDPLPDPEESFNYTPSEIKAMNRREVLKVGGQIHDEAIDVLCRTQTFHVTLASPPLTDSVHIACFGWVQRLQFDIRVSNITQDRLQSSLDDEDPVASLISRYADMCPRVRRCTIFFKDWGLFYIEGSFEGSSRTARAISLFRSASTIEQLSINIDCHPCNHSWG